MLEFSVGRPSLVYVLTKLLSVSLKIEAGMFRFCSAESVGFRILFLSWVNNIEHKLKGRKGVSGMSRIVVEHFTKHCNCTSRGFPIFGKIL